MNLNPELTFFSRVTEEDKILFARHLSVMAKSGISLSESVDVLIHQTKSSGFRRVLVGIAEDLENGQSLAHSLARYPKVFDPFYINLIEIGENSGNLSKNLIYLAEQLEKSHEFRSKVRGALFYPMIVLTLAFVVGVGVGIFALPQLVKIFQSFDTTLPWNTQLLIWFAGVMRDYGIYIFFAAIGLAVIFRALIQVPPVRFLWHSLVLRLPLAGPLVMSSQIALMSRNLSVMIQGGVPISAALEIQEKDTENLVFRRYIGRIREAVNRGNTIASEFFSKDMANVPPMVGKMIDVGEKSGKIDESFAYLADFFEEQVDGMARTISASIEPVLLFVIAGIVAFVALSIITPIYQLTSSINPSQ